MDRAFAYLESESGKHFDPDLVSITFSIRKTIEAIFDNQGIKLH
jgi:response regulator RpfG family c-di-GMP phosphodiesterase